MSSRAAVILAAGQGTRMKSPLPKVLHRVGGRAMLDRAIDVAEALGCERVVVVAGVHSPAVAGFEGDVVVTNADCPLLSPDDLSPLFDLRAAGADLALLAFEAADPALYGRVLRAADGRVERIVEAREASPEQLKVTTCYAGMLAAPAGLLFDWLGRVRDDNAKREFYLTDIVGLAVGDGRAVQAAVAPETAVMGADSQAQLATAEAVFQRGRRAALMAAGVNMAAPDTVHLSWDTEIAGGVVVEPYVVFGAGVTVESGAVIRAFSHLEGCTVGPGALVGPYARLRPGADIGPEAHIGNFVEVKKVKVGAGAKANHLAYLGDGTVGAGANIGAGTIFCNYDGFDKFETHVGEGAFIGSNTALVAPVRVGKGAMTGSGSVITRDVADDALAIERTQQTEKPGWAARFRALKLSGRRK